MEQDTCCVAECDKPIKVQSRKLCGMHDMRRRRYGDVQPDRPSRDARRDDGHLWCSSCSSHKPPDDFHRNCSTKTGRDGVCIVCVLHRRANARVHRSVVAKAYRAVNRDRILAGKRREYAKNREKYNAAGRRWRAENPERVRLQIRAQNAARYARLKNASGRATPEQIAARWAYYGDRCWICRAPATDTDHVKPLVGGGSNWPANLRPACMPCNRGKGGKWGMWPLDKAVLDDLRRRSQGDVAQADPVNLRG